VTFLGWPQLAGLLGGGWPPLVGWARVAAGAVVLLLVDGAVKGATRRRLNRPARPQHR
jgi:hypothetical protein